jgi:CubicO group peptidase (beta-lactamase class C family)
MKKHLILVLIYSFISTSCQGQISTDELDKRLTKIQKQSNFPGFAVAIVNKDSILFSKGYGFSNRETKTPYSINTIQPIGSVSKTFIGLALMKSIELGYFTLETNINDVLPFSVSNPNFPDQAIKIKHLATHTSSLVDDESIYYNVAYQLEKKPTIALAEFLKQYYSNDGKYYKTTNFSTATIGTKYEYSNIASALMAYIIEYKSGMEFSTFTKKHIFDVLKMEHSNWFYNDNFVNEYATLYMVNEPEIELEKIILNKDKSIKTYSCVTYPDGSLKTSVADLMLYTQAMIKGNLGEENTLISSNSYQTLFKKQFNETNMPLEMDKREPNRAIFWAYNKAGEIRHTGSDAGVFAFISIDPVTNIGKIMTINTSLEGGENIKTVENFKKIIETITLFKTN